MPLKYSGKATTSAVSTCFVATQQNTHNIRSGFLLQKAGSHIIEYSAYEGYGMIISSLIRMTTLLLHANSDISISSNIP